MAKTQAKKTNVKNTNSNKKTSVKKIQKEEKVQAVETKKNTTRKVVETSKNETTKEKVKKILKRIFDIVFWIAITILAIIWLVDFFKLQNDKEPVFCLNEKTHKFEDGTVYECKGLGYNIYKYDRESIDVTRQFSPFFIGMKK